VGATGKRERRERELLPECIEYLIWWLTGLELLKG
jgi:hypothetical protein